MASGVDRRDGAAKARSLDLGTARLAYVERGAGTPALLVHGSNSDHRTWDPILDRLGERVRAIAYSRRYHWPNEPIGAAEDYSMPGHVADLEAAIDALAIAPTHLVGHSYGGFLCLLLAIRRPALVRSLVLAEPPVLTLFTSSTPTPAEMIKLMLTRPRTAIAIGKLGATGLAPAAAALRRGDLEGALERLGPAVLGRASFRQLSSERREQARVNLIPAELTGSVFSPLDDADVRAIRCPTLLLEGAHSRRLFHRMNDRLAQLLPGAERLEIPRASHLIHEDNPDAWTAAVLGFLARVDGGSPSAPLD